MSESDSDQEMPQDYMPGGFPGMEEPKPEEHVWLGTLSEKSNILKFEGCDDAESSLILKRATLDADCDDESRHVVEIIGLDHTDARIQGTLCSLTLKNNCSVTLSDFVLSPPTAFKLVKGKGPLTICGNLMKEMSMNDSDLEEIEEDEALANGENGKVEEMETSSEEEAEVEAEAEEPKKANGKPNNKRKSADTNGDSPQKPPSKSPKKDKDEVKAKIDANKEKPDRKPIKSAKDLIEAIKASKGGKPSKRGKFDNWVKNQFKVDNKDWTEKAWKAVQEAK